MVERSYNGWDAAVNPRHIGVVPLTVGGIEFVGGVRGGDVHTVLGYIAEQFHAHVEPLKAPGCWGWAYRANRNANNLSCHASATAIDCNAPEHPNGVEAAKTFTPAQIRAVHQVLASIPELDEVVHWGGDWHHPALTPDPMHFEIHDHDTAKLARVAARIRNQQEDDMAYTDWPKKDREALIRDLKTAILDEPLDNLDADGKKTGEMRVRRFLVDLEATQDRIVRLLDQIAPKK